MSRLLRCALVVLIGLCLPLSCVEKKNVVYTAPPSNHLRIAGSDTMLPLLQKWAARYEALKGIQIEVSGGGSGSGIEQLVQGTVDICAASRTLTPVEVKRLHQYRGSLGIRTLTAKDAISIYLHEENTVRNLTKAQLNGIFTGKFTNWNQVGGPDLPIVLIGRPPNSGTWLFFKEHVLGDAAYAETINVRPDTDTVAQAVSMNTGGIGYGGILQGRKVTTALVEGVAPDVNTVRDETYPLTRYLYLYTTSPLEGARGDFIKWVLGLEGQQVVREVGFYPLWEDTEE